MKTKNSAEKLFKKNILIVDGGSHLSKLYSYILSSDYSLTIKKNGIDALAWLEEGNDPDLIITSLRMPYLDGCAFIQNLKLSGFYRNTPVMLLSGDENLAERVEQMAYKVDSYLEKPFDPNVLKMKITKLIA